MRQVNYDDIFGKNFDNHFLLKLKGLNNKSILVTGAQGMLGGAIARSITEFVAENPNYHLDVYLASRDWGENKDFVVSGSSIFYLSNQEARAGLYDFNFIIHCASPSNFSKVTSFEELLDINQKFLEDCIGEQTECVTFISSGEVYGGNSSKHAPSQFNLMQQGERGFYPLAKLMTETYLANLNQSRGLAIKILRLFHTFGPGLSKNDGRSFSDFLYAGAENRPIYLKTDGKQIRSFLYLGDATIAILHFALSTKKFELHDIGSNLPVSIGEFAETVAQLTLQNVIFRPENGYKMSPFSSILPDIRSAKAEGWEPRTNLLESITRTIRWISK